MQTKLRGTLLGVVALAAIVAIAPHAFAQQGPSSSGQGQQNGIPLGASYGGTGGVQPTTVGGDLGTAWAAGIAIIGVMSGIGVWTAVRHR